MMKKEVRNFTKEFTKVEGRTKVEALNELYRITGIELSEVVKAWCCRTISKEEYTKRRNNINRRLSYIEKLYAKEQAA